MGCPGQGPAGNASRGTRSFRSEAPVGGSAQHPFPPRPCNVYILYIHIQVMCDIYPCGAWAVEMHAVTTGCHSSPLLAFWGHPGTELGGSGGDCEPQEGAGCVSCPREPARDGRKRCQLILARKGSGAGAPKLQGTKREAPATKSGGTGGRTAPEGVWWKAQGGSNPPTESRGQGLTLRQAPLVTAGSPAQGRARGNSHHCPWARGWDEPGRAPGQPHTCTWG